MGKTPFRDWIPAGEDTGGQGQPGGYRDFVPGPEPKAPTKEPAKTDVLYSCPECDFTTKYKLALTGHMRKHLKK